MKESQLPIWKSRFFTRPCHRAEDVDASLSNHTFKITIFVSMCNLEQFRVKNDILSITAWFKFESINLCACTYVTFMIVISVTFRFYSVDSQLNTAFPINFPPVNHLTVLHCRYLNLPAPASDFKCTIMPPWLLISRGLSKLYRCSLTLWLKGLQLHAFSH